MRSIIISALFGTLLCVPASGFGETNAECAARCSADKASRDEGCPQAYYEGDPVRAQCLQESSEALAACMAGCPQPEPQAETPPADLPPAEKAE